MSTTTEERAPAARKRKEKPAKVKSEFQSPTKPAKRSKNSTPPAAASSVAATSAVNADDEEDAHMEAVMNEIIAEAEAEDDEADAASPAQVDDEDPVYDGVAATRAQAAASVAAATAAASRSSAAQDSDSEMDSDASSQSSDSDESAASEKKETDTPGDDWISCRSSSAAAVPKIPKGTDFVNPNNTVRYFSVLNRLNLHYTQIRPTDKLKIVESADQQDKKYYNIRPTVEQLFDFSGGAVPRFDKLPFPRNALIVGPAGVAGKFTRMFPYGDRDPIPNSKFPAPDDVSKIRYKLSFTREPYAACLAVDKEGLGQVDADVDVFENKWLRASFDKWGPAAAFKWAKQLFPEALTRAMVSAQKKIKDVEDEYNTKHEAWLQQKKKADKKGKKAPPEPVKPDLSEEAKNKVIMPLFIDQISPAVRTKDDSTTCAMFQAPLLISQSKKQREKGVPYHAKDAWFRGQFSNPPKYINAQKEEKDGFPKILNEVLLYRAVTAEEAKEFKQKGFNNKVPFRLVPWENRFVEADDVVIPAFEPEVFDSKLRSEFRLKLRFLIWIGEKNKLNEATSEVEGVCPTTYFRIAQKYERTKENFNPNTVENTPKPNEKLAAAPVSSPAEVAAAVNDAYQAFASE